MVDGFAASKYCKMKYKYIFKNKIAPAPESGDWQKIKLKDHETLELFEVQKWQTTFLKALTKRNEMN